MKSIVKSYIHIFKIQLIKHLEEFKENQTLKYQINKSVKDQDTTHQNVIFIQSIQKVNMIKLEEFLKGLGFVNLEEASEKTKDKGKKGKGKKEKDTKELVETKEDKK